MQFTILTVRIEHTMQIDLNTIFKTNKVIENQTSLSEPNHGLLSEIVLHYACDKSINNQYQ